MGWVGEADFSSPSIDVFRTVDLYDLLKTRAPAFMNPQVVPARCMDAQFDPQEACQLFYDRTRLQLDLNSRIFVESACPGVVESKNTICCEELPRKVSHQMRVSANQSGIERSLFLPFGSPRVSFLKRATALF